MRILTMMGALCMTGTAATAWPMLPGVLAAHSNLATITTTSLPTDQQDGDDVADTALCIYNFSKDDCGGVVEPGRYKASQCPTTGCRTIVVRGAVYEASLRSSNLGCGTGCESRCDEFPDGKLVLTMNYVLRADSCCPYRGSWDGQWTYTVQGRVFSGRAHGTIGVGTNRVSNCNADHDNCEPCYDVRMADGSWHIGFEGSFQGSATSSVLPYQEDLHFTMDGTWIVNASTLDPFRQAFRVLNRFDGSNLRWSCQ